MSEKGLGCTTAQSHFEGGSAHAVRLGFQLPELSPNGDAEAISANVCVMVEDDVGVRWQLQRTR